MAPERVATPTGSGAEIRVGLIGYGLAGAVFHAPLIAVTPGMRLAAVVTAEPERERRAQREHPGVLVLHTAEQLWERAASLDLVVVDRSLSTSPSSRLRRRGGGWSRKRTAGACC
jgi:hypothetical protein